METQPSAPPVVAVVVTCDPGPWFEEALRSLAGQDYPNLSVLVVDSASRTDPTARVAAVAPDVFVKRLDVRVGYGRALNVGAELVEGASHFLFCHDDVVLAPDAVRQLVEEAYRSNAGIVSPKIFEWDRPDHLQAVGLTADKVGAVHELVDAGELDQEQHDAVRDVFVAPGCVLLVRSDLFSSLGGFDSVVDQFGEDLDLSWRAQVLGARVVVAPTAQVRHLQALRRGQRPGWSSLRARQQAAIRTEEHRLRTVATCYGLAHLLWVYPLALLYLLGEGITELLRGHPGQAFRVVGTLPGSLRSPGRLWRSRRAVQRQRAVGDGEIRRLQSRGNARLRAFLRARVEGGASSGGAAESARHALADPEADALAVHAGTSDDEDRRRQGQPDREAQPAIGSGSWKLTAAAVGLLVLLGLIGSWQLLGHDLPSIGQIPDTSGGPGEWWRAWWSTWSNSGLGRVAPGPPALALLSAAGVVFFGAVGTLQHVLVLGPLVVGPWGAYRAARSWGSRRGRVAALAVYATVPVAFNALAQGRWAGLLSYAAAPWVLAALCRLSGVIPFPAPVRSRTVYRLAGLALGAAVVAAFVPSYVLVVVAIGAALWLGSLLAGRPSSGLRALWASLLAAAGAAVLLLPWSAPALTSRVALFGPNPGPAGRVGLGQLLLFHTGPIGSGPLGWALLVAAALPLLIGRSWRLEWATRLWVVALTLIGLEWAGGRGWLPVPAPEVLLAPAAAALAASVALGVVAFELDLPGYRFGWRQLLSAVAAAAAVVAAIPALTGVGDGRWHLPASGPSDALAFLPDNHAGDYRVLWAGDPRALPLASYFLADGTGYATSYDGPPDVTYTWTPGLGGATPRIGDDLRLASGGLTTKLGHLLAPMSIRYIVVPNHDAPAGAGARAAAVPAALLSGLQLQTDLQGVPVDPNFTVYQNAAWSPVRTELQPAAARAAGFDDARGLQSLSLPGPGSTLLGDRPGSARGSVSPGTVYVSATRTSRWTLQAGGARLSAVPAFGWAMAFEVPPGGGGPARLEVAGSTPLHAAQTVEIVVWVMVAAGLVAGSRRRSRRDRPDEEISREWFEPMTPGAGRGQLRSSRSRRPGLAEIDTDEVWDRV